MVGAYSYLWGKDRIVVTNGVEASGRGGSRVGWCQYAGTGMV